MNDNRCGTEPDASASETPSVANSQGAADKSVAELQVELADVKDRLLRAIAEQENIRRRTQRERDQAERFAASGLARDLLPTVDNLRRAIESVSASPADEMLQQLLTGVAATERGLLDALEKHGIRRFDPLGEPFDPERHQAMFAAPDAERPPGTVIQVLQPGYLHYDRLLRPAMVGVAQDHRAG
jgi:molecular chaperone GrpE